MDNSSGKDQRGLNALIIAAAAVPLALGLSVVVGWYTETKSLIQVLPGAAPMQMNTALGLVLCGGGLLSHVVRRSRVVIACASAAGVVALLTIIEYLFGIDVGIDQLLMEHYVTDNTSHPGRMAPNTALSLLLSAIAILAIAGKRWKTYAARVGGGIGSLVLALGLLALLGYISDLTPLYGWGELTRMAVHTAVGFVFVGAGLVAVASREDVARGVPLPGWLPVPVFVAVAIMTLGLWLSLSAENVMQIDRKTAVKAEVLEIGLRDLVDAKVRALVRMGNRWEQRGRTPRNEWEADASFYVDHDSSYEAIGWVDTTFRVRWMVPMGDAEEVQGLAPGFEQSLKSELEAIGISDAVAVSRPIDLAEGEKGFLIYVPLFPGGQFDGLILGIIRVNELFAPLFENRQSGYFIRVFDGDEEIYRHGGEPTAQSNRWTREIEYSSHGVTWRVAVLPSPELLAAEESRLPGVVLGIGFLMS